MLYASLEKKYKTLLFEGVSLLLLDSRYHVWPSSIEGWASLASKIEAKENINVSKINLVFIIILTIEFIKSSYIRIF